MSATELVCAAASQQRLHRSSIAAALQPTALKLQATAVSRDYMSASSRRGIEQPLELFAH